MATITVYVQDNGERRRRRNRHTLALLALGVIAIAAVADRMPPVAQLQAAAQPQVVEKIVYVDRLIPQAATQAPAPSPQTAAPQVTPPPAEPRPARPRPATRPAARNTPQVTRPAPAPVPEPDVAEPQPEPAPQPPRTPRQLLIEPRAIHFVNGGSKRVALFNPNDTPVAVFGIRIPPASASAGFRLHGQQECVRTIQPRERCYFTVSAAPGANGAISILLDREP